MFSIVLLLVAAIITVFLGGVVFLQNKKQGTNRNFGLLSLGIAGWIVSNVLFVEVSEEARFAVGLSSYGFAAILALSFFMFCNDISVKKYSSATVLLANIVGGGTVVLSMIPGLVAYGTEDLSMQTHTVGLLLYGAAIVALFVSGIRLLVSSISLAHNRMQQSQIVAVLIGLTIAAVIGVVCNLILPLFDNYSLVQYGPLGSVVLVLFCAYSMVRHGLFDIKLAVVRSVAYVFSLTTLAVLYYLLAYFASTVFFGSESSMTFGVGLVNIILALVLAFLFQPVKGFFDRVTDQVFYRDRYDTSEFLIRLGGILTSTTKLKVILESVGDEIRKTLKSNSSLFLIFRDNHDNEVIGEGIKNTFTDEELAYLYDVTAKERRGLVQVERLRSSRDPRDEKLYSIFSKRGVVLALPLVSADETVGYFMLGEHMSGAYSQQDIEALNAIVNELVIAVQNARSVQALRDLNVHLEQRVESATSELLSSNEKLRQLDAAKDEFVSMASHQLRTPLTSVKGYISMVLEGDAGDVNPMQRKLLEEAFTSSERMVHLIGDFLNVSRLQTGKFVLDRSLVNLSDLVEEEVDGLKATAKTRDLNLRYDKPAGELPSLYIDDSKIHQVVMNFIDNAIFYSTDDTTIKVRVAVEDDEVVFEVQDTGIGVPEQEQAQLFTKFFRASNAKKQRPDGTGIGLYLAKKVIDAHDGSMIFSSAEGKGSTFGFRLPVRKLNQPPSEPAHKVE